MHLMSFPGGLTLNLDQVTNIALAGQTFTFTLASGSAPTYVAANPTAVLKEISDFVASGASGSYTTTDIGTAPVITGCSPSSFPLQSGTTLTITGYNFASATLGTVYVVDLVASATFTPTFVSSTELTAVWLSNSDAPYTGPANLFYTDSNNVTSNYFPVTVT